MECKVCVSELLLTLLYPPCPEALLGRRRKRRRVAEHPSAQLGVLCLGLCEAAGQADMELPSSGTVLHLT